MSKKCYTMKGSTILENGDEITYWDCCYLLNELFEENESLREALEYIQNSITEHIKHQKTELGQKALKEIIEDYNEWIIGHKPSNKPDKYNPDYKTLYYNLLEQIDLAITTERTKIGQNVLKQLKEANTND